MLTAPCFSMMALNTSLPQPYFLKALERTKKPKLHTAILQCWQLCCADIDLWYATAQGIHHLCPQFDRRMIYRAPGQHKGYKHARWPSYQATRVNNRTTVPFPLPWPFWPCLTFPSLNSLNPVVPSFPSEHETNYSISYTATPVGQPTLPRKWVPYVLFRIPYSVKSHNSKRHLNLGTWGPVVPPKLHK